MNNDACDRYLESPEEQPEHLSTCEQCAALFGELDDRIDPRPLPPAKLPLAPWEGAGHKAWSVAWAGLLTLGAIATALFLTAGVKPESGFAMASQFPSPSRLFELFTHVGSAVSQAPGSFQVVLFAGFAVVNALLYTLLRRAPKGIDAPRR